ncbi:hypothetical protein EVAR_27193_1 [Eumeta japonica]|uniref:Uncharacterized protein n=1 Tax=Eumeta variegata TaxID=151549 RepID=A0A4C1VWA4_EUMVA|nr:hypothetical protein EVAR_27193_1 [Eumeta japonica]
MRVRFRVTFRSHLVMEYATLLGTKPGRGVGVGGSSGNAAKGSEKIIQTSSLYNTWTSLGESNIEKELNQNIGARARQTDHSWWERDARHSADLSRSALDLEAALRATDVTGPEDISPASPTNNIEISIISEDVVNRNDDPPKLPEAIKQNAKPPQVVLNTKLGQNLAELTSNGQLVKPIILVNDKPPDDLEGTVVDMTKIAILQERNIVLSEKIRAKRRFFTNKRRNVYKRSYSIA